MDDNLLHRIDSLIGGTYPHNEPGAAAIVVKNGQTVFRKGYGMANLELSVPIEPDMVFRLGSITKQFTAVAILMLLEQHKLSLDDPITRFLPNYPSHDHLVTVEHLLTHTSGIVNYTVLPRWMALERQDLSLEDLIDLFKDEDLQFAPGDRFSYSNSGYVLLGAIIEVIAGSSYPRFVVQHIFESLGMKHSCYDIPEKIITGRVAGYQQSAVGYKNAAYISMTQPYSAGALASTVDDLAIWDSALYTERLVRKETLQLAFTPYRLTDGSAINYGYGWRICSPNGHILLSHDGLIEGFATNAIRAPADRVFVALLSNNAAKRTKPTDITTEIVNLVASGSN